MTKHKHKLGDKNTMRDIMTNKRVGNKEVVIVDNAIDYVKKQGYIVTRPRDLTATMFTLAFLVMFLFLFSMANVYAASLTFDKNAKVDVSAFVKEDFNSKYGMVTIKDNFYNKLNEYSLTHKEESIIDIAMYGKVTVYQKGSLFDDKMFLNEYGQLTNLNEGKYYIMGKEQYQIETPIYKEECSRKINKNTSLDSEVCYKVQTQTIKEDRERDVWIEYKDGVLVNPNNYYWKFEGKRNINQKVDVQPCKNNICFTPWVWFNSSWGKKQVMNITETSGVTLYNYQVRIVILKDGDMNTDYSDLRFVNTSETEEFSYWIENYTASNVTVWVKFDKLTASTVNQFYMYFKNPAATSKSNGTSTFIQFGEFRQNGGTLPSCWFKGDESSYTLDLTNGLNLTTIGDTWDTGHGVFNNCTSSTQMPFRLIGLGLTRNGVNHAALGIAGSMPIASHIDNGNGLFYNIGSGNNFQLTPFTAGSVGAGDSFGTSTFNVSYRMELRVNSSNIELPYVNNSLQGTYTRAIPPTYYLITGGYHGGFMYRLQELFTTNWTLGTQPTYNFGTNIDYTLQGLSVINSLPVNNSNVTNQNITFQCNITSVGTTLIYNITLNVSSNVSNHTQFIGGLGVQSYNATFYNLTLSNKTQYNWFCDVKGNDNNIISPTWTFYTNYSLINVSYSPPTVFTYDLTSQVNVFLFIFMIIFSIAFMIYINWELGSIFMIILGFVALVNMSNRLVGLIIILASVVAIFVKKD